MSKKSGLTFREETRQRGVSHGTVFRERKAKKLKATLTILTTDYETLKPMLQS